MKNSLWNVGILISTKWIVVSRSNVYSQSLLKVTTKFTICRWIRSYNTENQLLTTDVLIQLLLSIEVYCITPLKHRAHQVWNTGLSNEWSALYPYNQIVIKQRIWSRNYIKVSQSISVPECANTGVNTYIIPLTTSNFILLPSNET